MVFRLIVFGLAVIHPMASSAQFSDGDEVKAGLIAEVESIQPGQPFMVGVRLEMKKGWHTYWVNPGDTGIATTVKWRLPDGFSAGPLQWPVPHRYDDEYSSSFAYSGEVLLSAKITPPATIAAGMPVKIEADVAWLACEFGCIPGEKTVSLELPVSPAKPVIDARWKTAFENARAEVPAPMPGLVMSVASPAQEAGGLRVSLTLPEGITTPEPASLAFFIPSKGVTPPSAKPEIKRSGDAIEIRLKPNEDGKAPPSEWSGVLVSKDGFGPEHVSKAILVSFGDEASGEPPAEAVKPDPGKVSGGPAPAGDVSEESIRKDIKEMLAAGVVNLDGVKEKPRRLPLMLLFAFLGGIILNVMPCVFPVLGIKIMGFVQQAGDDKAKIRMHGLVFGAGVVVSLWLLVAVLILLRLFGDQVGWGFQLQSPGFLAFMIALLFGFGLSLSGVFEIGTTLAAAGGGLQHQHQHGYVGSFFSGGLAVLVATPCTGPFMGPALGFALSEPPVSTFLIFTFLALGLAFPYVLLSFFPALIQRLPRPGAWMVTFKQFMAFPLYATCIWLLSVFMKVTGSGAATMFLFGLLFLAIAGWVFGRYATPAAKPRTRRIGQVTALTLAGLTVWFAYLSIGSGTSGASEKPRDRGFEKYGLNWLYYTPRDIIEARKSGRPVYIDFTAEWCLTCQSNKKIVFEAPGAGKVIAKLKELHAVPVIADWTKRDWMIGETLAELGESGVPFNMVFPADPKRPAIVLPRVLTQGIVLKALEAAK